MSRLVRAVFRRRDIMVQPYKVIIERDSQGEYLATFPALVGCQAQAASLKTLMQRILEATVSRPELRQPETTARERAATARPGS
jgi:hypothetical protein